MAVNKTETLNMRVRPQTKRGLQAIAEREKRSMANALECLVDEYLSRNQITVSHPATNRNKERSRHGGWA